MSEQQAAEEGALKSVDAHREDVLDVVRPLPPVEKELIAAYGCVLAEPVTATTPLPAFDNSAMDGYAVRAADVAAADPAHPVRLPVVADIAAGDGHAYTLSAGECARIMTGAPVPDGADAIVPVEWTDGGTGLVEITSPAAGGSHVRVRGGDVRAGDVVLEPGTRLGAVELGMLAAVGRAKALVRPKPRVVVLSTGAELVEPGGRVGPGSIWDSNSFMLSVAATEAGGLGDRHGIVTDEPATVVEALHASLDDADALVTSGGVSMGAHDVVKEVLREVGTVRFERVAMQPGMPQGFGVIGEKPTPIFTMPGNPVSSYVSFQLFVRPALRKMLGLPTGGLPTVTATLTEPVTSPPGKRQFRRAWIEFDADGGPRVTPIGGPGSHLLASLARANSLLVVPETVTRAEAGESFEVMLLPGDR